LIYRSYKVAVKIKAALFMAHGVFVICVITEHTASAHSKH